MKQIILGIHGLGNKPPKDLLEKWWVKSIREGLNNICKNRRKVPFEMIYWADILHEKPLDISISDEDNPLYISEPYIKGSKEIIKHDESIKEKIIKYIGEQLDKVFLNKNFTLNFQSVTDSFIKHYFKELDAYYNDECKSVYDKNCGAKNKIQERLVEALNKYKDYEILLVAHSMGSIIALDVLSSLPNEIKIHTFVTIGSPLGLPVVNARVFNEQKKINPQLEFPIVPDSITNAWFNISDELDRIALDHTLNDDYKSNKYGVIANDLFVNNDYANLEENHHKSFGYLRANQFSEILDDFLVTEFHEVFAQKLIFIAQNILGKFNIKNWMKKGEQ